MKRNKDYDKLVESADIVCGICLYRNEETCNNCPVRKTIDNYYKK